MFLLLYCSTRLDIKMLNSLKFVKQVVTNGIKLNICPATADCGQISLAQMETVHTVPSTNSTSMTLFRVTMTFTDS